MAQPTVSVGVPLALNAGDSSSWEEVWFDDPRGPFRPTDGWALTYDFVAAKARKTFAATIVDDKWLTSATGDELTELRNPASADPETVTWFARVSKDGDRFTVKSGKLTLHPDSAELTKYESTEERELALVSTAIEKIESGTVSAYTVGNRAFTKHDLKTLYARKNVLLQAIASAQSGQFGRTIDIRFSSVSR